MAEIPTVTDADHLAAARDWAEASWPGSFPRALHDYIETLEAEVRDCRARSGSIDRFAAAMGGTSVPIPEGQDPVDFFVQRQAAIRNGEDPDDPEVAVKYRPEGH